MGWGDGRVFSTKTRTPCLGWAIPGRASQSKQGTDPRKAFQCYSQQRIFEAGSWQGAGKGLEGMGRGRRWRGSGASGKGRHPPGGCGPGGGSSNGQEEPGSRDDLEMASL